ncbi:tyrosine-type recombinase/integrase [Natribacillus halophilus]|uniref:Site-specific recombinase XerD n=1 Tax=Natribacillus halophilus TaxID=549003 RepID=A0A1G8RVJ4_9BACI|nr:site-specific integrase [Natribacillus halophilus]SDJ20943.1 Site-specific recombinase XerD [Natribacillus halophilus]
MGSVEKRGKNKYRLSVVIGYTEKGKAIRERRNVQAKNHTEAKKELSIFESEILTDQYIRPEKMTLRQFYEREWLVKFAPTHYGSENTLNENINIIENRILPTYGSMSLSDIKTIHVVNFVDDLKKHGRRLDGKEGLLSASTIRNCYKAMNSLLAAAKTYGLIKDNPADGVKAPVPKQSKVQLEYSIDNVWKMIEAIKTESFEKQVLFWIAFVTSAREAEVAALEDKHILADKNAIRFEQSLLEKRGGGVETKSIKNNLEGVAAIPEELTGMIQQLLHEKKKHKMMMGDKWQHPDNLFLFANEYGVPIRPDSISQWWIRFIHNNYLEKIRFHDLRHLSITFLIEKNVPMKSISERARHSKIGTTMDFYGHNIVDVDRVAASHFSEFFNKKGAGE